MPGAVSQAGAVTSTCRRTVTRTRVDSTSRRSWRGDMSTNAFFFKGDSYVRYNIADNKVDDGYPLKTADQWPGMGAAGFGDNLDAAINWGNGHAFFFKGDSYVRYNIADNKVDDGYPLKT